MNISAILELDPGIVVPTLSGRITKVFPAKSGQGQHGPWTLVPCKLQDSTGEIEVKFWSPTFTPAGGQNLTISAFRNQKNNQLGGVVYDAKQGQDRGGNPVTYKSVAVSASAIVQVDGAGAAPASGPANAQKPTQARPNPTPLGQTVGMALKLAGDIWIQTQSSAGVPYNQDALASIESIATDILRLSARLEKLDLSAPPAKPAAPAAQAPADDFSGEPGDDNIPF